MPKEGFMLKDLWTRFGRAVVAVTIAGLTVVASSLTDNRVSTEEWIQVAIQTTTIAGVWLVPNLPHSAGYKTATAAILAVLNLATTLILDGINGADVINLVLAALGVLGVAVAPSLSKAENLVSLSTAAAANRQAYRGS
jgi:hypothetical protein